MRFKLGLCALLVAAACGGGSNSGADVDANLAIDASTTPDATPVVTLDDICGTGGVYQMLVAKLVQCNPALDLLALQGQATPAAVTALCHGAIDPYLPASIDLPSYAQLQACLTYISSTACLDLDFNASPCNILHGKVTDTMGCDSTEQCLDASYCDRPDDTTCGTCKPREIDGTACTADEQCMNGKCVGAQCGHPGKDGDPCVLDANGNSDDCLGQRVCNKQTHECETKTWALNDTCANLGDCGLFSTDLYCKPTNGTINTPGQCAHYLAINDTCNPQNLGAGLCDLRSYEWCNPNAGGGPKCSAPNVVVDGHACGVIQGNKCGAGLVCSNPIDSQQNPGKCYTPGPKDAACGAQGDSPCAEFLTCIDKQCEYTDDTPACP